MKKGLFIILMMLFCFVAKAQLSIYELFWGMVCFHYYTYYSLYPWCFDTGNIVSSIFIGEEKEMKNVSIDSNSSYWLDELEISDVDFDSNINVKIEY